MSGDPPQRPGVGVAIIIRSERHPGCAVLGIRKGSTGAGQFALPGGHLEHGYVKSFVWLCLSWAALYTTEFTSIGVLDHCTMYLYRESLEDCAIRETKEETALTIHNVHFGTVVNSLWTEPIGREYHFVTIAMIGDVDPSESLQEPENTEPHKCEGILVERHAYKK